MAKRHKKKKRLLNLLCFIILIVFIFCLINKPKTKENNNLHIPEKKETWPKTYHASLVATGDALMHSPLLKDAYNSNTKEYDFSPMLAMVKDVISKYDIAYYNQETVFGGEEIGYSSYPTFNTPSALGDAMVNIGFNVVSLASNHSADCRSKAYNCINSSYDYWKTKNVVFDGFNDDEDIEKNNKYNIGTVNGITYGFLNYTNTLNGLDGFLTNKNHIIDLYDEETVKKEVENLKEKVDIVIVAMHWHKSSAEYSFKPTESNINIAKYLDSLGVDIILGTYSHCVQPFDILENGAIVFYSLGNFISNQMDLSPSKYHPYVGTIGMLASMDITKTVYEDGTKDIKIDNIGADLLYTYRQSYGNGYVAIPFSKMNESYNKDYKKIYEEYSGYITKLNNNITIKEAGIDA